MNNKHGTLNSAAQCMRKFVHAARRPAESESVFQAAEVKGLVIFKGNENGREAETYFTFSLLLYLDWMA